ncbi:MAG: hydroxymethylbilane synthase [Acidobacteriota bacterium]|nr:hydroxymethylbilane synthase [Acidobacteriota bacterium]
MRLRIGTRGSALALWQSRHVAARLSAGDRDLQVVLVEITSAGDRLTDVPLSHVEGTGFFTAAIEQALAAGEIDVAVHSFKDLPVDSTAGLIVAAVPERGPVEDVLCGRDGLTLATLPAGARVGTCSTRRTAQVRLMRQDLEMVTLRGNVPTRVARVGRDLDAIVLARAGLVRLGLDHAITEVFAIDRMVPAPAQGALAIQCRIGDTAVHRRIAVLDDAPTRRAVEAERTMLHVLGGGCSVPVGAIATPVAGGLSLSAAVFNAATGAALRVCVTGADPVALGQLAAARLMALGAGEILAAFASSSAGAPA